MTTLKIETVRQVVKVWNVLFGGQRSGDEQKIISAKFHEALAPAYSNEAFLCAARMVEKETNFFPTIKNFLDVRESVHQLEQRQANYETKALPEETGNLTDEEVEQNHQRIEIIKKQLAGEMSMEEAVMAQKKLVTYVRK